jgi:large subunit ribosomal protein L15
MTNESEEMDVVTLGPEFFVTRMDDLFNWTRPDPRSKRVGRGQGSGLGKTCGRGQKGRGARSGCVSRAGYEGGQFRTFMKLPIRGFNNAEFRTEYQVINLDQINSIYSDGETVNMVTLIEKGFLSNANQPLKILGSGELTKKVVVHADAISASAKEKLLKANIEIHLPK